MDAQFYKDKISSQTGADAPYRLEYATKNIASKFCWGVEITQFINPFSVSLFSEALVKSEEASFTE